MSLSDYLAQVTQGNLAVQASKLKTLAQKHKIKPNATIDDPFIAAGIDEIPFGGNRGKIRRYQISQTIPFPGKLEAKAAIAEKRTESSEFDTQTVMRQIHILATQAFLRTSYNHHAILLNERIQKIIQDTIASAKARYKTGASNHHEWLLATVELAVLNVALLRLRRTQVTLFALLNELRNLHPNSSIEIEDSNLFNNIDESKEIHADLDLQPELNAWKAQKEVAGKELKLIKLSYAPDFVIQVMAMEPNTKDPEMSEPSSWGVMIGMTLPLFFWRKQSELV
ncbi:MAG: TolC family protein, partial [Bdellovibrionota bacterium]